MPVHWESLAEPIPGYRLVERLGRGGFGEVWKATAPGGLDKAIKFVHGEIGGPDTPHAQQELKALERIRGIRHPFILTMERFDIINGQLVIVTELADCNLEQRLNECQKQGLPGIPRKELLGYMVETADALDHMSASYDLQHLDIKPQNIFLVGGHVKVADFGLVKDLEGCTASVTGGVTPVYAPPETFDGWVSRNTDQYSLAIVFQELLTGSRPFSGPSARQYMMQHLTAAPDVTSLPACDQPIVRKALSKDPKERFTSCMEFVEALRDAGKQTYSTSALTDREHSAELQAGISTHVAPLSFDESDEERTAVRPSPILDRQRVKTTTGGTLRPTLVIGIGQTGLHTLDRLRAKLNRRFGAPHWPAVRVLGIDVESTACPADVEQDHVLLCKYRKPNQYFQLWDTLTSLKKWLDPNLMFQISPTAGTNGYRALGRLAFFENYRRLVSRLRSELEDLIDSDRIQSALAASGLALRTDEPRICIVASMSGGTGSGMFVDLCYLARRILLEAGVSSPDVEGYLVASSGEGSRSSELRRVNTFALAQDLLNLGQPDSSFAVDYEGEGEIHRFTSAPARSLYFFDADAKGLPEPKGDAVKDVVAEMLHQGVTSAVGKELDAQDRLNHWPAYRSAGIFSLAYPLRDLLRGTSSLVCGNVAESWKATLPRTEGENLAEQASKLLANCGYSPESIAQSLLEACNSLLPESIHVLAAKALAEIETTVHRTPAKDQGEALRAGFMSLKSLLGADCDEEENKFDAEPLFDRVLNEATNSLVSELMVPLVEALNLSLNKPGPRLDRARATWNGYTRYLLRMFDQQQEAVRTDLQKLHRRIRQIDPMLQRGTSSMPARLLDAPGRILESMQHYIEDKISYRLREHVIQVYLVLRGRLSDWSRELVRVRQSLDRLVEGFQKSSRLESTATGWSSQALYPGGMLELHEAVDLLYQQVSAGGLEEVDGWLQESTISALGGFWTMCSRDEEFEQQIPEMFVSTMMRWIQEGLAGGDACSAFFDRHQGNMEGALREIDAFRGWAEPSSPYRAPAKTLDAAPPHEVCILALPSGGNGQAFRQMVEQVMHDPSLRVVDDSDECVLCRLQAHEALARMLPRWVLGAKSLYDAAIHTRLSPMIFRKPES